MQQAIVPILVVLVLLAFIAFMYTAWKLRLHKENHKMITQMLLRQTSRWAVASQQDKSPMIAVLHANYAVGYLDALQSFANDCDISDQVDLTLFKTKIMHVQDVAVRKAITACPNYLGKDINTDLAELGISMPIIMRDSIKSTKL